VSALRATVDHDFSLRCHSGAIRQACLPRAGIAEESQLLSWRRFTLITSGKSLECFLSAEKFGRDMEPRSQSFNVVFIQFPFAVQHFRLSRYVN
jgi:hypothetical protein